MSRTSHLRLRAGSQSGLPPPLHDDDEDDYRLPHPPPVDYDEKIIRAVDRAVELKHTGMMLTFEKERSKAFRDQLIGGVALLLLGVLVLAHFVQRELAAAVARDPFRS